MARMPGGMVGGSPAPASSGASFDSVTGSFSRIDAITPRLTTSSGLSCAPGSGVREGQGTTFTSPAASRAPIGSGLAATSTKVCATSTSRTGMC